MDQPIDPVKPTKRRGRPPRAVSTDMCSRVAKVAKQFPNLPVSAIADKTGVERHTVSQILAKYRIDKTDVDQFRDNQADILMGLQHRICAHITDEDIQKSPFRDKIVALGITIDKYRLVTGESTANIASWIKVVQDAQQPITHKHEAIDPVDMAVPVDK